MSEERENIPEWLRESLNRSFIDSSGKTTVIDLPDGFENWQNFIKYNIALEAVYETKTSSKEPFNYLIKRLLPKYTERLDEVVIRIGREIIDEYAQWKNTCGICRGPDIYEGSGFFTDTHLCLRCLKKEFARVKAHNERALKRNLPATLTLEEWVQILKEHDFLCAYCEKEQFQVLDHKTALSRKGDEVGTTARNCVPACKGCNNKKGSLLPHEVIW